MSRSDNLKLGFRRNPEILSKLPVRKLSTQSTRSPRSSSVPHKCEPRKPAPPATRTVLRCGARSVCGIAVPLNCSSDGLLGEPRSGDRWLRNECGFEISLELRRPRETRVLLDNPGACGVGHRHGRPLVETEDLQHVRRGGDRADRLSFGE